jgi:beta-galactosidase
LEYQVLRCVYGESVGDLPFDLPPYVFAHYREGLWVAVNYTDKPTPIPVPKGSHILLGTKVLQPGEVLVWQD